MKAVSSIKVSICCAAYNHGPYLRQCLESFLMQRTSFAYEIWVHDDASTDDTTEILREYAARYPDIIHPVYQQVNQYSQGTRTIITSFLLPLVQGEYVALCEGDDYWTSPFKLQKQVDWMDKYADCSLCFHGGVVINPEGRQTGSYAPYWRTQFVPVKDIIQWKHHFCQTASLLFRKKYLQDYPSFCRNCHVGDYPLVLFLALSGRVCYLNEKMSAYRKGHAGSWTHVFETENAGLQNQQLQTEFDMLDGIDRLTGLAYHSFIHRKKMKLKIYTLWRQRAYEVLKAPELRPYFRYIPLNRRIGMFYKMYIHR